MATIPLSAFLPQADPDDADAPAQTILDALAAATPQLVLEAPAWSQGS